MGEGTRENSAHDNQASLLYGFYLEVPPQPHALTGGLLGSDWYKGDIQPPVSL